MKRERVLITGAGGFIGAHLTRALGCSRRAGELQECGTRRPSQESDAARYEIVPCPREAWNDGEKLAALVAASDVVVHLAGMNRGDERRIHETNTGLADRLADALARSPRGPHVVYASSTHRDRATAYGRSKKYGEERLKAWAERYGERLTTLVLPNAFGPGCRPFYNSAVATFCHQLAHDQQPVLIDDREVELVWINDLIEHFCTAIDRVPVGVREARVLGGAKHRISEVLARLESFRRKYFEENVVPDLSDPFDAQLYTTFLSHIELDDHCHRPRVHADERGQLCEVLRLAGGGQVFFSSTKPGAIRGDHFHTRKVEWFCVLRGEAMIRIRRVGAAEVREFRVSGSSPQFISIPALHTHQIENVGAEDLLTMFWCNEIFQAADPDTYFEKVA